MKKSKTIMIKKHKKGSICATYQPDSGTTIVIRNGKKACVSRLSFRFL